MNDVRTIRILGFGVIIALLAVGYFFVAQPFFAENDRLKSEIMTAQESNERLQTNLAGLSRVKLLQPDAEQYDAELTSRFPTTAAVDELRTELQTLASQTGVEVTVQATVPQLSGGGAEAEAGAEAPAPAPAQEGDAGAGSDTSEAEAVLEGEVDPTTGQSAESAAADAAAAGNANLATMTVTLEAKGPRDNIIAFMDGLQNLNRALSFGALSLAGSATEEGNEYTLSITGISYLHRAVEIPEELPEEAPETTEEPTDTDQ